MVAAKQSLHTWYVGSYNQTQWADVGCQVIQWLSLQVLLLHPFLLLLCCLADGLSCQRRPLIRCTEVLYAHPCRNTQQQSACQPINSNAKLHISLVQPYQCMQAYLTKHDMRYCYCCCLPLAMPLSSCTTLKTKNMSGGNFSMAACLMGEFLSKGSTCESVRTRHSYDGRGKQGPLTLAVATTAKCLYHHIIYMTAAWHNQRLTASSDNMQSGLHKQAHIMSWSWQVQCAHLAPCIKHPVSHLRPETDVVLAGGNIES